MSIESKPNPHCDHCDGPCRLEHFNGIALREHCPECDGKHYDENPKWRDCYTCDNRGVVFTDAGLELLEFVEEYARFSVRVN